MKRFILAIAATTLLASFVAAQIDEPHTFANTEGKTLTDTILKYDFTEKIVTLEKSGKVPLDTFSAEDQKHILHWNQVSGFLSSMRFKMEVSKANWGRMKHEQNVTPIYMDAIMIPGKATPNHTLVELDDYEEYNAVYLEAQGFDIKLRNQNIFPIENIVIESKVFFEQEEYILADSMFLSDESEYFDTVTTNLVRFLSETLPIIIPREEIFMHSEAAVIVDHQVERNSLTSTTEDEESEEEDDEDEGEEEEIIGFGDWDDHARRRKGRVNGVWFRIGIKGLDGEMVWRLISFPSSIKNKWDSWDVAGLPESKDD